MTRPDDYDQEDDVGRDEHKSETDRRPKRHWIGGGGTVKHGKKHTLRATEGGGAIHRRFAMLHRNDRLRCRWSDRRRHT